MEEDGAEWEDEDEEFKGVDTSHEGGEYGDLVRDTLSWVAVSKYVLQLYNVSSI